MPMSGNASGGCEPSLNACGIKVGVGGTCAMIKSVIGNGLTSLKQFQDESDDIEKNPHINQGDNDSDDDVPSLSLKNGVFADVDQGTIFVLHRGCYATW